MNVEHSELAAKIAKSVVRRYHLVEADYLSAAWVGCVAASKSYDPSRGALSTWMWIRARNEALDLLRLRKRVPTDALPLDEIEGNLRTPEELASRAQASARLRSAMDELRDRPRFVMRQYAAGLEAVEIAAQLGVTPRAVRLVKHRAVRRLRELMVDCRGGSDDHIS